MARIEYQELIDLDGYRKVVAESRADYKAFSDEVVQLNAQIKQSMTQVVGEIQAIQRANSTNGDGKQQEQYANRVAGLTAQLNSQRQATQALSATDEQLSKVTGTLLARQESLLNQYANLAGTSGRVVAEKKRIAKELVNLQDQFNKLDKSVRTNNESTREITGQYNKLQRELSDARKELKALDNAFDSNTGKINKNNAAAVALAQKINVLDTAMKKADSQMGVFGRNVGNYPTVAQQGFAGLTQTITRLGVAYLGVDAIFSEAKAMLRATTQAESLSAALEAVHTSATAAAEAERFIYQQANKLGAEIESTSNSYITLAGATRGSALEGAQTERVWNAIITAGRGMRRSNEEIQRAVIATGQVFSKQKVQAEELSGQLAEALPGSLQILSKELGVSTRQLLQMAQDGKLLAIDVLPALASGLEKAYSQSVADNADNIANNTNRMTNAIQAFRKAVFEESGAKSWFSDFLKDETEELRDWIYLFKNFKDIRMSEMGGTQIRERRKSEEMKNSTYDSFRALSLADMQKTINAQEQADMTTEQRRHVRRLREIYQQRIDSEKKVLDESGKQHAQMEAENNAKNKSKREAAANKARAEAEKQLREALAQNKANTGVKLSGLDTQNASGGLSEVDYLGQRLTILQDGVLKEQAILRAAGKENTADYTATQQELNDIAAEYIEKRNKLQEDAFKRAIRAVKDGLSTDENYLKSGLQDRLTEIETAYESAQAQIQVAVAKRQITEGQGEEKLYKLRLQYLDDIQVATEAAYDTSRSTIEGRIATLRAEGKTEVQIAETIKLERDALAKAEKERDDALNKNKRDQAKATADEEIAQAKRAQEAKDLEREKDMKRLEVAGAAIAGFFEITAQFREQDMARLEKQKENELALVGDNENAKANIEQKFAEKARELKRRQAGADKAAALFQIALATAEGAIRAAANPLTLALVPFIIALGAIQAGVVAARPLPEFWKGTSDAPEGPAWVGERGYELIESKKGGKSSYRLAADKQVAYLNKHDRVYTHQETKKLLQVNTELATEVRTAPGGGMYSPPVVVQSGGITKADLMDAFASQTIEQTILTEDNLKRFTQKKNQRTEWKNGYFSLPRK